MNPALLLGRLTAALIPCALLLGTPARGVATQAFVPFPNGSEGNLCLGGAIGRHVLDVQSTGATGTFGSSVDLTSLPTPSGTTAVRAGETWNFQAWFRDPNPNPTSNFTDGVSILFH